MAWNMNKERGKNNAPIQRSRNTGAWTMYYITSMMPYQQKKKKADRCRNVFRAVAWTCYTPLQGRVNSYLLYLYIDRCYKYNITHTSSVIQVLLDNYTSIYIQVFIYKYLWILCWILHRLHTLCTAQPRGKTFCWCASSGSHVCAVSHAGPSRSFPSSQYSVLQQQ